eukprot:2534760-Rhodomonas_salina.1
MSAWEAAVSVRSQHCRSTQAGHAAVQWGCYPRGDRVIVEEDLDAPRAESGPGCAHPKQRQGKERT